MESFAYRVSAGDTLSAIAQRYNVPMETLARLNGLSNIHLLWVGQELRIPGENRSTFPTQANKFQTAATKTNRMVDGGTTRTNAISSDSKTPKNGMFERGTEIRSFGRVRNDGGVNFRDAPGGALLKRLPFNTRVFVSHELPGDWYFVTLDDGSFGYVARQYVSINPPESGAFLHKIKKGEGALEIVKTYYKGSAVSWGQDERYYVNVLVEANRGKEFSGIYKPNESADWSKTQTRENYLIWIPTLEFAKSLRGKVSSGSLSYEAWQAARRAAETVGDFLLGAVAFQAGLIHGALESVWDLVTGILDLAELVWDIFKSVITGNILSDVKGLWKLVTSIKPAELIDAGLKAFLARWNDPSFLRRWHFRGWMVGYAIAEILMAIVTGSVVLVKWAGKAGKFSKLIAKFPRILKAAEKVTELSKRIPEGTIKRLRKGLSRSPDAPPPTQRKYVPWSGQKYVGIVEPILEKKYAKIRETLHDAALFLKMYKNTGISRRVLERVYKHVFHTEHEVAVAANKLEKGYFAPDSDIGNLWTKAMTEKLSPDEAKSFRKLMAHEYVESKLMEQGFPYRSAHPDAWQTYEVNGRIEHVSGFTHTHHGAHDLAPHVTSEFPLRHWRAVLGVNPPDYVLSKDLSDLDKLVQDILKMKKRWK